MSASLCVLGSYRSSVLNYDVFRGFSTFYNNCSPSDIAQLLSRPAGLNEGQDAYIKSNYNFGCHGIRAFATNSSSGEQVNLYEVLGVTPSCSKSRIKIAYYKLSKKYHPDVNKTEEAKKMFQEISEAYDVLSNDITREQYDKTISSRASFSPGYRSRTRHGQDKYKPRGVIYPMGRSSMYNIDEWHRKHYQTTLEENRKLKYSSSYQQENLSSFKKDIEEFKKTNQSQPMLVFFLVIVLGCLMINFQSSESEAKQKVQQKTDES